MILRKDRIELDFQQQKSKSKMHVTSNPFFKFHDDVFPKFAKNAVGEIRKFPQSASSLSPPYPLSIVPNYPFASFKEELFHISSFELDLNQTQKLNLEMKKISESRKLAKIIEFRSFNEKTIFQIESFKNDSMGITSDFFHEVIILEKPSSIHWTSFEFVFEVKEEFSIFFIVKRSDKKIAKRKLRELQNTKDKRIRLFKFDDETKIKNLFFFQHRPSQIHVILQERNRSQKQYALFGDGSTNQNVKIFIPKHLEKNVDSTKFALLNGRMHLFGGIWDMQKVECLCILLSNNF